MKMTEDMEIFVTFILVLLVLLLGVPTALVVTLVVLAVADRIRRRVRIALWRRNKGAKV